MARLNRKIFIAPKNNNARPNFSHLGASIRSLLRALTRKKSSRGRIRSRVLRSYDRPCDFHWGVLNYSNDISRHVSLAVQFISRADSMFRWRRPVTSTIYFTILSNRPVCILSTISNFIWVSVSWFLSPSFFSTFLELCANNFRIKNVPVGTLYEPGLVAANWTKWRGAARRRWDEIGGTRTRSLDLWRELQLFSSVILK